jgi:hypothetical protein
MVMIRIVLGFADVGAFRTPGYEEGDTEEANAYS